MDITEEYVAMMLIVVFEQLRLEPDADHSALEALYSIARKKVASITARLNELPTDAAKAGE